MVSGPLSVVGCESDAVEQTGATGDVGPADVCPLEYVPSPDSSAGCDAPHFLRNEAISAHVSGPLSVAHGGALATAEPGLPDSVAVVAGPLAAETAVAAGDAPATDMGHKWLDSNLDTPASYDDAEFLRNEPISHSISGLLSVSRGGAVATQKPGETDRAAQITRRRDESRSPAIWDGFPSVIEGTQVDAIHQVITAGAEKDDGTGIDWSGLLRELQAGRERDFGVDRAPPGAAGGV